MDCHCNKESDIRKLLSLLLAEDDDSLRETLYHFFASQGFQVFPAGSGTEAIDIARKQKISFSIMDINMPGLNGIEAFKFISREIGNMPCIFMSADASQEVMHQALGVGAFSFLSKPIEIDLMRTSVERLIRRFFRDLQG